LKSLDLSKNYGLTSLSSQIGKLRDLEFLGLAFDSELKSLPAEIAQLVKLQEITGLDAGFVESPDFEQLKQSMKNTRISGSR
jgi:Leucine-rich repeat (LRR) protein